MKTLSIILISIGLSLVVVRAEGPVDTAKDVAKDAADTAANVGHKVVRGTKRVVHRIADVFEPEPDARRVEVTLSDDKIDMPGKIRPGKTAFVVHNSGKQTHSFVVEGDAGDYQFEHDVKPGQTKVLHVPLTHGTYSVRSGEKDKGGATASLTVR